MRRGFRSEPQIGVVFSLSISLFLSLLLWQTRTSRCCTKHTRELCGNINERIISKFSRLDTWQLSTVLEGIDEIHIVRILLLNGRFYLSNGVYPDDKQESRVYKCVSKYDPCWCFNFNEKTRWIYVLRLLSTYFYRMTTRGWDIAVAIY